MQPAQFSKTAATGDHAAGADLPAIAGYEVRRLVGEGGMGRVYEAVERALDRRVAVKVIRPEYVATPAARVRFFREAKALARVRNPHVVVIHSVGETGGAPYLVMEYLDGLTLGALLSQSSDRLPPAAVVQIAKGVAAGLTAIHGAGIVHRDIKPENVWLEPAPAGWHVRLLDFGVARDGHTDTVTAEGKIVGTPHYMAPEQAAGRPVDARADLFSLGCVLYELLTGARPFPGPNLLAVIAAVAGHQPKPPRAVNGAVPIHLSALTMRLLAKDPAARPSSAAAVVQELEAVPAAGSKSSRPLLAAGAAVAGLVLVAAAVVYFRGDKEPAAPTPPAVPPSLVSANTPPAGPNPAPKAPPVFTPKYGTFFHGYSNFNVCLAQPLDEYLRWAKELPKTYLPHSIDVVATPAGPLFTVVAVETMYDTWYEFCPYVVHPDESANDWEHYNACGMRVYATAAFRHKNRQCHATVWIGRMGIYEILNGSVWSINTVCRNAQQKNYAVQLLRAAKVPDGLTYLSLTTDLRRKDEFRLNLDQSELIEFGRDLRNMDYNLDHFYSFEDGREWKFTAVGSPRITKPPNEYGFALDREALLKATDEKRADGFCPTCVTGYFDAAGTLRFNAIWGKSLLKK